MSYVETDYTVLKRCLDKRVKDLTVEDWSILKRNLSSEQITRLSYFNNYEIAPDIVYIIIKNILLFFGVSLLISLPMSLYMTFTGDDNSSMEYLARFILAFFMGSSSLFGVIALSSWLKSPEKRIKSNEERKKNFLKYNNLCRKYFYNKPVGENYEVLEDSDPYVRDLVGIEF